MKPHAYFIAGLLLMTPLAASAQDDSGTALDDASSTALAGLAAQEVTDSEMDAASGNLVGVAAASGPIAFGVVYSNGSKQSGTSNWSATYNSTYKRYEITITGQNYYYLRYSTLITPAGDRRFCRSSSVGGRLLVYCHDQNGVAQPSRFGFVTFKN